MTGVATESMANWLSTAASTEARSAMPLVPDLFTAAVNSMRKS